MGRDLAYGRQRVCSILYIVSVDSMTLSGSMGCLSSRVSYPHYLHPTRDLKADAAALCLRCYRR